MNMYPDHRALFVSITKILVEVASELLFFCYSSPCFISENKFSLKIYGHIMIFSPKLGPLKLNFRSPKRLILSR